MPPRDLTLERFRAKWIPVRVKETRQNKNLEPRSDSIGTEKAPEDIADWLTPRQAVKILDVVFQKSYLSKQALLGRLVGGLAEAVARQTVAAGSAGRASPGPFEKIPAEVWRKIQTTDTCWVTGDLVLRRRSPSGMGDETVSYYAVRFEPQGVRSMIGDTGEPARAPPAEARPAEPPEPEPSEPEPSEPRRPPVSAAHLQAWFEFYQKIGGDMREERALESARLNFAGQSITRKRIRDLLGPRPIGRPRFLRDLP
jgi:hypothetical protein